MLRICAALLTVAALAAPVPAFASDPGTPGRSAEARGQREDPKPVPQVQPELICRSVEVAGTNAVPMVCLSAAEWRRIEQ